MNQHIDQVAINDTENEIEIDLLELLFYFRGRLGIILSVLICCALLSGCITHFLITPRYQAMSKLYMVSASNDSVVDLTDLNLGTSLSSDYEELLKIRPILDEIIEEETLPYDYDSLLKMITISAIEDTRILVITVESINPAEAQSIANALADKAVTYLPELMDTAPPNIAEHAIYPEKQSSPSMTKNMVLGAAVGVIICLAILTVLFLMDDTLKSAEDVEKFFGIMPLTVIPEGDIKIERDEHKRDDGKKKKRKKAKKKKRGKNESGYAGKIDF